LQLLQLANLLLLMLTSYCLATITTVGYPLDVRTQRRGPQVLA
jgi:hypothetical protein